MWSDIAPSTSGHFASWVQAVGSIVAIAVAIYVPWRQHRAELERRRDDRAHASTEEVRLHKERLRRLLAGLRVEIEQAITFSEMREETVVNTLAEVSTAISQGRTVTGGSLPPGMFRLTDAIIYRQVVAELGYLPNALVRQLVFFYSFTEEIGRQADLNPAIIKEMAAKVRMHGMTVIHLIESFERTGFTAADVKLELTREEAAAMAKEAGYSLERVLKERGLELPRSPSE